LRNKSGKYVWISSNGVVLRKDKNNKPLYMIGIHQDITDYRNAQEKLKGSQEQLRDLTAHLQSIREQERTLIAREMHDELGQSLTALKMDLSWLDRKTPKDQKPLVDRIISMRKLIDSTLQTVKRISSDLRPELLDDLGLSAAIEWQGEEFQNRTGIKSEVAMDPEEIILDQDCSTAIFRIFQETLTNVARHSHATRVIVKLKVKTGKIELKVKDNGKGITVKQISNPKSFGLIGIRERVHFLDGDVEIKGVQNKGTTVTVRIPIPKEGKAG
jgi:signal transduction histidine kinase